MFLFVKTTEAYLHDKLNFKDWDAYLLFCFVLIFKFENF